MPTVHEYLLYVIVG